MSKFGIASEVLHPIAERMRIKEQMTPKEKTKLISNKKYVLGF